MSRFTLFSIVLGFAFLVNLALAKVDPPNYDFSLETLDNFKPGKTLKQIEEKYGKGSLIISSGSNQIYKFMVEQLRYKFPVFVQVEGDRVLEFYARLPQYFLHDVFHQSLINRIGMQDKYFKLEEQAIYQWKNKDGLNYIYSGACTITCFPIYYSVSDAKNEKLKTILSQINTLGITSQN